MNKRENAKRILAHHFRMAYAESELNFDADCYSDIDLIVDNIVDAAKEEIIKEIGENENG